jgi:hypothetical protein
MAAGENPTTHQYIIPGIQTKHTRLKIPIDRSRRVPSADTIEPIRALEPPSDEQRQAQSIPAADSSINLAHTLRYKPRAARCRA